jgi:hypothetical protein
VSITLVPRCDFAAFSDITLALARVDSRIRVARSPSGIALYFAGARAVAREGDSEGLAMLRLCDDGRVAHVDLDGYEGSVQHLEQFLRALSPRCGGWKIWDDATGEDLTELAASRLFEAGPRAATDPPPFLSLSPMEPPSR